MYATVCSIELNVDGFTDSTNSKDHQIIDINRHISTELELWSKFLRLLHSPSLVAIGLSVGVWDMVSNWMTPPFVIVWSQYKLDLPGVAWMVGSREDFEFRFSDTTGSPLAQPLHRVYKFP